MSRIRNTAKEHDHCKKSFFFSNFLASKSGSGSRSQTNADPDPEHRVLFDTCTCIVSVPGGGGSNHHLPSSKIPLSPTMLQNLGDSRLDKRTQFLMLQYRYQTDFGYLPVCKYGLGKVPGPALVNFFFILYCRGVAFCSFFITGMGLVQYRERFFFFA